MEQINRIEKAQQIKDILEPIPAEAFIERHFYGVDPDTMEDSGKSCALGHIHRALHSEKHPIGDGDGYGARKLTSDYLQKHHNLAYWTDISSVNNEPTVNGYTQPDPKSRVLALVDDMIKAGY